MNAAAPRRGLREAHAHIAAYGESLEMVDLSACRSVAECLELVRRECRGAAAGQRPRWLRMTGARVAAWEEARWPTIGELDASSGSVPCVLMSFDHHAACANSAAIRAAGLKAGEPVPPHGMVCADPCGVPTGLLLEQAAYRAWSAAPAPTDAQRAAHVLSGLEALARLGYTEVHDLHSQEWLLPALRRLEEQGRLPVERIWLYTPLSAGSPGSAASSERVRWKGYKAFLDGTLNSRTALMLHDYAAPLPGLARGKAMMTERELEDAVRRVEGERGAEGPCELAVHAIGDGAVRTALDVVERVLPPPGGDGSVVRLEHCEVIDAADVPRFAELGVVCSVQPCHLLADIEALRRYLPHRLDRVLPLRELIDSGCRPAVEDGGRGLLWFGSDVPIVRADPGDSIVAATMRRRPGTAEGGSIAWEQRIRDEEAWGCFGQSRRS